SVPATFSFASIGNIEARLISDTNSIHLLPRRGILGLAAPRPDVTQQTWTDTAVLILHSDGLRSHWRWEDFNYLAAQPAGTIAHHLLNRLAVPRDDATVVVVK